MKGGLTIIEMGERKQRSANVEEALNFIEQRIKNPCMGIDGRVASLVEYMLVIHAQLTAGTVMDSRAALEDFRRSRGIDTCGEKSKF